MTCLCFKEFLNQLNLLYKYRISKYEIENLQS
jgi:hypothetical protein